MHLWEDTTRLNIFLRYDELVKRYTAVMLCLLNPNQEEEVLQLLTMSLMNTILSEMFAW